MIIFSGIIYPLYHIPKPIRIYLIPELQAMRALRRVPASTGDQCGRIENHRSWWLFCWAYFINWLNFSCWLLLNRFCFAIGSYWFIVTCDLLWFILGFLPFTKNYLKSASLLYGTIATYLGGRYRGRLWRKIARRSGKHYWFFCNYMPDGALIIHYICWLYILVVHASLMLLVVNLVSWCCLKLLLLFDCLVGLRKCYKITSNGIWLEGYALIGIKGGAPVGGVNATTRSNPWIGADSLATRFFWVV